MTIENLHILSLLVFIIIVGGSILLGYNFYRKREILKKKYVLLFHQDSKYYLKYIFLVLTLTVISLSIFGLRFDSDSQTVEIQGIDIVFVLDVSKSMNVEDIQNTTTSLSRLSFSKAIISEYTKLYPENRFGLVIFAGNALSISPLTTDQSTFLTFLENVDYRNMNAQGSSLEKAIELGVERLYTQEDPQDRSNALVLISDGGDADDKINYSQIKEISSKKAIAALILGVGTNEGGRIPDTRDFFGNITYQQYRGQDVVSKLNENSLQKVATTMSGNYYKMDKIDDIENIQSIISGLETNALEIKGASRYIDASRFLAMISFFLFLLYIVTPLTINRGLIRK